MNDAYIKIRLSEELKEQALRTFETMGISASEAIRVFLTRTIAEQRIPFEVKSVRAPLSEEKLSRDELTQELLKGKHSIEAGRCLLADEAFTKIRKNLSL